MDQSCDDAFEVVVVHQNILDLSQLRHLEDRQQGLQLLKIIDFYPHSTAH
jgi:hypothetical protein